MLLACSRTAAGPRALLGALQPSLLAALQQQERHAVQEQRARAIHSTVSLPTLFFDVVGASPSGRATVSAAAARPTTLCVLHGLLGVGRNLRGIAQELCKQAAERSGVPFHALLLDLRSHGRSARAPGLHGPHTLAAAAQDVVRLWQHELGGAAPDLLIGHSMGGKTALEVVRQLAHPRAPTGQPKQVWVLDARPNAVHGVDAATSDVQRVLSAVKQVPQPLPSRQALYDHLQQLGFSTALQHWLGSSLVPDPAHPGQLVFAFNAEGAQQMFDDYCRQDYSQLLRAPPRGTTLHILRALRSDRWDHETLGVIRAAAAATAQPAAVRGRTCYHELPDAGHWVHTDNPRGLVALMLPSLLEAAKAG